MIFLLYVTIYFIILYFLNFIRYSYKFFFKSFSLSIINHYNSFIFLSYIIDKFKKDTKNYTIFTYFSNLLNNLIIT